MATQTRTTTKTTTSTKGFAQYEQCADAAQKKAEDDRSRREAVANSGNLVLLYFLREVQRDVEGREGATNWLHGLRNAVRSVQDAPLRIRTRDQLKALRGVGDFTARMVDQALWKKYPPGEPDSDEEQIEREASGADDGEGGGGRGKKDYVPRPGTANYAFLVLMYMAKKRDGTTHWTKEDLMAAAQASGLAEKDIRGTKDLSAPGGGANPANFYDGFSCFRGMISKDPQLVLERTKTKGVRGKDYSLTNAGWALAARVYKYREVQPLPGLTEAAVHSDITTYCSLEGLPLLLEAYPAGTPKSNRGGSGVHGFRAAAAALRRTGGDYKAALNLLDFGRLSPAIERTLSSDHEAAAAGGHGTGAGGGDAGLGLGSENGAGGSGRLGHLLGTGSGGGSGEVLPGGATSAVGVVGKPPLPLLVDLTAAAGAAAAAAGGAGRGGAKRPPAPSVAPAAGAGVAGGGFGSQPDDAVVAGAVLGGSQRLQDSQGGLGSQGLGSSQRAGAEGLGSQGLGGSQRAGSQGLGSQGLGSQFLGSQGSDLLRAGSGMGSQRAGSQDSEGGGDGDDSKTYVLDAVCERKKAADLLASVQDRRYGQQKWRLQRCGLRRLYYLLEEPIEQEGFTTTEQRTMRTSIQSALLQGFTVLRTRNADDTARQLAALTRALERQHGRRRCGQGACALQQPRTAQAKYRLPYPYGYPGLDGARHACASTCMLTEWHV
eukprot:XP_001694040.1 predicted protein [Chlamydomonas reinhardtii]